jgi:hypothetical protein
MSTVDLPNGECTDITPYRWKLFKRFPAAGRMLWQLPVTTTPLYLNMLSLANQSVLRIDNCHILDCSNWIESKQEYREMALTAHEREGRDDMVSKTVIKHFASLGVRIDLSCLSS